MSVQVIVEFGPYPGVRAAEVRRRVRAMMSALQLENEEVSIVLTNDDQIQQLNKLYRRKNKPTDVLAFAQREGELSSLSGNLLGDVVVSVPTARRQAAEAGRSVMAEVTMLLAHGLLHLLGWDHDTPAKDRRMRAETDRLCAAASPRPRGGVAHQLRSRPLRTPEKRGEKGGGKGRARAQNPPLKGRTRRAANHGAGGGK